MTEQEVLDRLLAFEGVMKAIAYDSDRVQGGSTASPPPGVRLHDGPGSVHHSPYHFFSWMFSQALDSMELMRLRHLAEEILYKLENPEAVPNVDLKALEERICAYGEGLTNEEIARWTGLSALQVGEIRKANDLDHEGRVVVSVEWLKQMAFRLFSEGKTESQVALAVNRSERHVRRWRAEMKKAA